MDNTPVYEFEDAVNFISDRCDINKEIIEKVLLLEEDYMRSIGIITDGQIKWNFQVEDFKWKILV